MSEVTEPSETSLPAPIPPLEPSPEALLGDLKACVKSVLAEASSALAQANAVIAAAQEAQKMAANAVD